MCKRLKQGGKKSPIETDYAGRRKFSILRLQKMFTTNPETIDCCKKGKFREQKRTLEN